MSKFLAPIHFWLFDKINYHEHLEDEIISVFRGKYGEEVLEIQKKAEEKYGPKTTEKNLENTIDLKNIHGWLQQKISQAELRQASIIAVLLEKYGKEGLELLDEIHRKVGAIYGKRASEEASEESMTAEKVYKILNDYILDGMPCDNVRQVVEKGEDLLQYVQVQCLHKPYWKEVGLDEEVMYRLRAAWVESFVSSLSENHRYEFERGEVMGKEGQKHKIVKI